MLYSLQGIVIRSMDYSESSKIISVLTAELGKISLMVRGAKKIKSKHTAITQLFTLGEFTFFKQAGKMGTLHQGEVTHSYHGLRDDLSKTAYAAYLAEMVDRLMNEEEASSYVYVQFQAALTAIEAGKDIAVVGHIFEMQILGFQGYSPQLDQCVSCLSELHLSRFSSSLGGLLCGSCAHQDRTSIEITASTLKLLRVFVNMDLRRLGDIQVKPATKQEIKSCMRDYMDRHIDISWKSRRFIDQMEKYLY